ncbi:MAG: M6 family metalloprotease domain-containing protein [Paludibacter sp.]
MNNFKIISLVILLSVHFNNELFCATAIPTPVVITQPDGSKLTIRLHGDEYYNFQTTIDGYLIMPDNKEFMTYAKIENGSVVRTNIRVSEMNERKVDEINLVKTLNKETDMTAFYIKNRLKRSKSTFQETNQMKVYPLKGTPKSLVLLVNFSDVQFAESDSLTAFSNLLNQNGYSDNGGTGSARDYFHDASTGVFNPQFDVFGPVTLDNSMAYYGANDSYGNDVNPRQMIIDACSKASAAGLDFSQYDTDNDGFVDNVFVYYAGYNEAEGGPKNSVWPHKWKLSNFNTKFNGKIIYNYACTSEFRGNTGNSMCGIGTFCHEFGHVLGLADYYSTSGTSHHTLSSWNIMDIGLYLNQGRTPPTYCTYDRYFLKWLTPVQLTDTGTYSLDTLASSNRAYLISQITNRTQYTANSTSYPEYFTLENRQQKGWDAYLPGHGMIVYHINYNATAWANNGPNNDANAMGVDLIEADGIFSAQDTKSDPTLSGDPFPGTADITSKTLSYIRNSTNAFASHTFSNVTETDGIISFRLDTLRIDRMPTVTTTMPTLITDISAVIGGTVINEGTAIVSERGICWGADINPTIENNKIINGSGAGLFTDTISGLASGSTFHYRAYATNSVGTSYGYDMIFTTIITTNIKTTGADILTIYPNPTEGKLMIKFQGDCRCSVFLFNALGQKVYSLDNEYFHEKELNLINICSKGIYWLKLLNECGENIGEQRILFK